MNFPFQGCVVSAGESTTSRVRELLAYPAAVTSILFDLQKFAEEMETQGVENIGARYLSVSERDLVDKFTSAKRKREWLGGRFAAKYAAAGLLAQKGIDLSSSALAVGATENGRPFLKAYRLGMDLPDISISHSADLAAAMAVDKGLCGIDIQKITERVVKVRERFCSADEKHILQSFFRTTPAKQSTHLTKLWAAKEALRKAADLDYLPGFLELELSEITADPSENIHPLWRFTFLYKHADTPDAEKCNVVVKHLADYVLALTVRNVPKN